MYIKNLISLTKVWKAWTLDRATRQLEKVKILLMKVPFGKSHSLTCPHIPICSPLFCDCHNTWWNWLHLLCCVYVLCYLYPFICWWTFSWFHIFIVLNSMRSWTLRKRLKITVVICQKRVQFQELKIWLSKPVLLLQRTWVRIPGPISGSSIYNSALRDDTLFWSPQAPYKDIYILKNRFLCSGTEG